MWTAFLRSSSFDEFGDVGGVGVHVVAVSGLGGTAMPAAIMGDHAIAVGEEEHHLRVPVVRGERPAMMEEEGLTCAPVLEVDLRSVFHCDGVHGISLSISVCGFFTAPDSSTTRTNVGAEE